MLSLYNFKFGFYTTRYVKAKDVHEASRIALLLINQELLFEGVLKNTKSDPPMFTISQIVKVGWWKYLFNAPGKGFSFFPENEDDYNKITSAVEGGQ